HARQNLNHTLYETPTPAVRKIVFEPLAHDAWLGGGDYVVYGPGG
ncbi:hypothetical protein LCGC14_2618770, partial [marine sediment metagenome]